MSLVARDVLTQALEVGSVLTSKGLLLAGSWAAVVAALVATSGLTSPGASEVLLASGAMIALTLAKGSRRD